MSLLTAARDADWRKVSAAVTTAKTAWDMAVNIRDRIETYRHTRAYTVTVDEMRH